MERTKHKFPFFFFQEKLFPTTNSTTACTPSCVEGVHNGYHNQWQPQLLGHVPLEGGLCSVRDMQTRDFKPWFHSPPEVTSAVSVTLAKEVTQKLLPGHTCHPQQSLELLLNTTVNLWESGLRDASLAIHWLLRSHQAAGWSQQPQGIEKVWPTFWSLTQTFLCIQLINALA